MSEEEEKADKSVIERIREIIPVTTPMIAIMGIAFTYYSYFYDIQKVPQLQTIINLSKVNETENAYIVEVSIQLKNESKSRIEIIGNIGKMYCMNVKTSDSLDSEGFRKMLSDSMRTMGQGGFIVDAQMDRANIELSGCYQPIHLASGLQPLEKIEFAFLSAISKKYDAASFTYMIDFSTSEEGILVKYDELDGGDMTYNLYLIKGKDTTEAEKISQDMGNLEALYEKYNISRTFMGAEIWLKDNGTKEDQNSNSDIGQE
jgi:hypothetical protein